MPFTAGDNVTYTGSVGRHVGETGTVVSQENGNVVVRSDRDRSLHDVPATLLVITPTGPTPKVGDKVEYTGPRTRWLGQTGTVTDVTRHGVNVRADFDSRVVSIPTADVTVVSSPGTAGSLTAFLVANLGITTASADEIAGVVGEWFDSIL